MRRLPIADCRLPIEALFAGRGFARRRHDGGEFVRFNKQRGQFLFGQYVRLNQQFEPQGRFVRFLFDRADFGNEFRLTARPATGAVVCGHRCAAADNLSGYGARGVIIFGDRPGQLDDAQGKGFGAGFKFGWIHGGKLQTQSAIGNRQSAISK